MLEIIMLVCSIEQETTCKEVRLSYMEQTATSIQCMLYGQAEMAKWAAEHPKWRVARWKCGEVRRDVNL